MSCGRTRACVKGCEKTLTAYPMVYGVFPWQIWADLGRSGHALPTRPGSTAGDMQVILDLCNGSSHAPTRLAYATKHCIWKQKRVCLFDFVHPGSRRFIILSDGAEVRERERLVQGRFGYFPCGSTGEHPPGHPQPDCEPFYALCCSVSRDAETNCSPYSEEL